MEPELQQAVGHHRHVPAAWRGDVNRPATRTGAGVTVAVVDSGLLQRRRRHDAHQDDARLHGRRREPDAVSALDGFGHGTHVAGLIGSSQAEVKGVAPDVNYVSLRVLDSPGPGLHEPRHHRHPVGGGQQGHLRHRHHQPLARPPDLRAGRHRPAGAGRRSGRARRHRRRGLGRQRRRQPDDRPVGYGGHHLAGQRAVGHHRRRRRDLRHDARAPTTWSPTTARAGRPGTTATPSPTWSRPGIACWPASTTSQNLYSELPDLAGRRTTAAQLL